ncbi:MAG: hypothetical protein U5L01_04070 [Rheinheimera sp.]|nr:hypothetical protein [Rheinheimera sp.]
MIRLMIGFAKDKFIGAASSDNLYLRGFHGLDAMPSPLGLADASLTGVVSAREPLPHCFSPR